MKPFARAPTTGVLLAIASAGLFGVSTPFSKLLLGRVSPQMLAGLLYLGSGGGLGLWLLFRKLGSPPPSEKPLRAADLPWLAGAVTTGGVIGPLFLMAGLALTPASTVSLLLNLEGVFTALIAWFVFRENFDRRIFLGMVAITAGGVVVSWSGTAPLTWGALLVTGACLGWAIDNNLTRRISAGDPAQIAAVKGIVAGALNLSVALLRGDAFPPMSLSFVAGLVGFIGYGVSLTFFVLALRYIGTARTGAYFSMAPFLGAVVSIPLFGEWPGGYFLVAGTLMGIGVWLHLTERHDHSHRHEALEHEHRHVHDDHHRHDHPPGVDPNEPHSHRHVHEPLVHRHAHYPDLHHGHNHDPA